ncbi:glucan biosynthesis protein [Pseudoruegeria sp. SK021]|uniref:glucan biosynthesis protein n=1 Tax=Pseudoruegeria sp. SK021 TaxID=1933035 RepID=UPI000A2223CE|nr:glucan biosynthesis protein G [Pseudoruegeria sp. SK021]OSP55948.1 glucan biosynthesis protein D [Pseudoruegeria sp. SK021]
MSTTRAATSLIHRRQLLGSAVSAAVFAAAFPSVLGAQDASDIAPEVAPFSFDTLTDQMRLRRDTPWTEATPPDGFLAELNYDDYRQIRFREDSAPWRDTGFFTVQAFHMGWLFGAPVRLFEVTDGTAQEMLFSTDDFEYRNTLADRVPEHFALPGVAGFRLNTPLNRPDIFDEVVAFVGASYFRALGRDSAYGMSARGLSINTASPAGEEFPLFTEFYLERPADGSQTVLVYAALESPSLTGAYRFVITPGTNTIMDVTARLFFRKDVEQLGVAPLTSMFLFSDGVHHRFDDYRPSVHDSEGLRIVRANGDELWRPLNNPTHLANSFFTEQTPREFGLMQRDRTFDKYQDLESNFERRPSLAVEPLGDWGAGSVRLVEIPTDLEVNDNIVAFWQVEGTVKAGDEREFSYRLIWGDLSPDANGTLAYVDETRSGLGGVSGVANTTGHQKFVIDFKGGILSEMPASDEIQAVVTAANGEVVTTTLDPIAGTDLWRLVLDIAAPAGTTVELSAHLAGYGRKLSETWLYQWVNE